MYQPWGKDPAADAIIKLIEEKERKEVKYSSYENDSGNWNIVSFKELGLGKHTERNQPKCEVDQVEQETSTGPWRRGRGQVDPKPLKALESSFSGSSQTAGTWGSKIANSVVSQNKQLRAEIDVELTVRKRSKSSEERDEPRARRRHASPQRPARSRSRSLLRNKKLQRHSRSRSRSLPRNKKLQRHSRSRSRSLTRNKKLLRHSRSRSRSLLRNKKLQRRSRSRSRSLLRNKKLQRRSRSRSNSRSKNRRSRSRSISRDGKCKRSVSRDRKRVRSNSRDRKRQRNSSRDRKAAKSVQNKSRSRSIERKRDTRSSRHRSPTPRLSRQRSPTPKSSRQRSPTPRSPTPKLQEKPAETTTEILSKFVTMMQEVKKEQPAPVQVTPNRNVLPEFDSSNNGHTIVSWVLRVEDVAKLFGWEDKDTMQYAVSKLVGDAKTWYQTLETVPNTWDELRKKLKEQFPCLTYAQLLENMWKRRTYPHETLEKYYYDKMLLINKCGFKGRHAVDCILTGIRVESIRLCGEVADFAEPEELLKYLKSVEAVWLENRGKRSKKALANELAAQKAERICFYCGARGHFEDDCWAKQAHANVDTTNAGPNMTNSTPHTPLQFQPQPRFKPPQQFQPTRPFLSNRQLKQLNRPAGEKKIKYCHICKVPGHVVRICPNRPRKGIPITNSIIAPVTNTSVDTLSIPSAGGDWNEPAPPGLE